ncbi:Asparagine-rich zinc finger protein AZF1 [Fusarium oxysporum f. sp. raphani]|uniref:C2H2 type master regulator of conidiophore development brlA n=1 Tax=Fusarium oxysporum f. sp. raphani TaxID=96318 RepID=A0A8J5U126_FUSOX|nr:Asparagine-rich zinc finger protein AZF1 [Fusarium oxysporum f. sp. raphani]
MALPAQSSDAPNWGRWGQQLPGDYTMTASSHMLPFDSRATTTGPLQRPVMAPYMVQPPYSSGPVNSLTAPHYQVPNPYQFGGYQGPPTPPHHSTPFKIEYNDRRPMGHDNHYGQVPSYPWEIKYTYAEQAPSPAPSHSQASTVKSLGTNPTAGSKIITSNETLNPGDQINFETEVDELMKAIQRKVDVQVDTVQQPLTPGRSPVSEGSFESQGTPGPMDNKTARKRYRCDGPNCQKSFGHKANLELHSRAHTGIKPYNCDYPGCDLTFSQLGNLKTHKRRHTGERPFACDKCDRHFAQRGNLRAHLQTHQGLKPFICVLDDCNKTFSQLGNMKTHQNNFHKKTLKKLTKRFAKIIASGEEVCEADRELFEYFATHYKNSNKGIKGRGKGHKVAGPKTNAPQSPHANIVTTVRQYPLPQIASTPANPHGLPMSGSLASYSVSRGQTGPINYHAVPTYRQYPPTGKQKKSFPIQTAIFQPPHRESPNIGITN